MEIYDAINVPPAREFGRPSEIFHNGQSIGATIVFKTLLVQFSELFDFHFILSYLPLDLALALYPSLRPI